MKQTAQLTIMLTVAVLALASFAFAAVPQVITYQGRLTDATGTPVADGPYLIKFIIWDDPTASEPANEKWNSGFQTVTVTDGLFNYDLGSNVALPDDLFTDTLRWLGITVGTDPEIIPRTKLTSKAYSYHALRADSAQISTTVYDNAITSAKVADGEIVDADINATANIAPSKIYNTAATLNGVNNFTTTNYFDPGASVYIGDSTFRADNNGIRIGDGATPSSLYLVRMERDYNTSATRYGQNASLINTGNGTLYGYFASVGESSTQGDGVLYGGCVEVGSYTGGSAVVYGQYIDVNNNTASPSYRYGVRVYSGDPSNTGGNSYALRGSAYGGTAAYGVYGYASDATTNYAGYFDGDVDVTGTLSKGGGAFKIDHPLDPENKYLQHSFVESPDMMNIYNGNVTLDGNGEATVVLPDYFEALNMDFRYQLTAIGAPGPNLYIAEKINGNQFRIAGGEAFMEVSWQVTGIRHDKWAEANRIQVEVDKRPEEVGTYLHPEEWGQPIEKHVNYEEMKEDLERAEGRSEPSGVE